MKPDPREAARKEAWDDPTAPADKAVHGPPTDAESLHLKVRGVALWIKTLSGQAPAVIGSAFDTLLQAADALSASGQSHEARRTDKQT